MKLPSTCTLLLFAIAFLHFACDIGRADISGLGVIDQASATSSSAAESPATTSADQQPSASSDVAQGQQSSQVPSDTTAAPSPTTTSAQNYDTATAAPTDSKNDQQTTTNDQSHATQTEKDNSSNKTSNSAAGPTDKSSPSDTSSSQDHQSGSIQDNTPNAGDSSDSSNNGGGPGTGVIVGAVVGGVAGVAMIGALVLWIVRRDGNKPRKQGFHHQPDDYTISMSGTGAAPGYTAASPKLPFQQQARPFIPPSSAGYANLATVQPYENHNNYQCYYDKPEERDLGADCYHSTEQQPNYYHKPDEPTVQYKPDVA
ncbi:hypothetical protein BX666DRAFT_2025517 [Dichotomocladium elegans]|nr:hypothetical protein BX666DRAFT_2025517 [Dichotomocladium elegans]